MIANYIVHNYITHHSGYLTRAVIIGLALRLASGLASTSGSGGSLSGSRCGLGGWDTADGIIRVIYALVGAEVATCNACSM